MIRAVTVDFWGTLMFDPPTSDNRYKQKRLADFEAILQAEGVKVSQRVLNRAYDDSGRHLGQIWLTHKDVPVEQHVLAILGAVDPALPGRLDADAMAALVQAYANPVLIVPPTADLSARAALTTLAAEGMILCVVSNTMRTPGAVLRRVLAHYGLLAPFSVLTFSDECGVRKPAPEIFQRTLREVDVAPEEAVHVGDDPVLDVQGAHDAGMRAIQVTAESRTAVSRKPDGTIRQLGELPAALSKLQ